MNRRTTQLCPIVLVIALFPLVGCDKEDQVTSYSAPKEARLVSWDLPKDWETAPHDHKLQYAAFVSGAGEDAVKISVSFLFAEVSGARDLLQNVNRWRRQLALPPVPTAELDKLVIVENQGGTTLQTIDMTGESGQRMRAIIIPREDRIWFFKMTGPTTLVEARKAAFDAFARSTKYLSAAAPPLVAGADVPQDIPASPHATIPTPAQSPTSLVRPTAPANDTPLDFTLPTGWMREQSSSPMRVATLRTGDNDKAALVIVTRLSANFGGMTANINRWRGEVGLSPATDDSSAKESSIKIGPIDGLLVDLAGPGKSNAAPTRSLIARATQGDSVWFFKLIGPAETVAQQQKAFETFLASVRLPG